MKNVGVNEVPQFEGCLLLQFGPFGHHFWQNFRRQVEIKVDPVDQIWQDGKV